MNEPQERASVQESKLDFGRLLPIIALGSLVLFGWYNLSESRADKRDLESQLSEQTDSNTKLQQQLANLETVMNELKTAKVYEQQEKSIAAVNALSVIERGEVLRQELTSLRALQERFISRTKDLEQSEEGQRIASDAVLVQQFAAALSVELPASDIATRLLPRIDQLLVAPNQALTNGVAAYVPADSLLRAFSAIESEAHAATSKLTRTLDDIDAIARQATKLPIAENTRLSDALATNNEVLEAERRALVAETIDKAKREAAQKLAEQEAINQDKIAEASRQAAELVGEQTAARIMEEAVAQKKREDAEKAEREAVAAKAKFEADFQRDEPEIRHVLALVVSDGSTLRGKLVTKGPASLSVLQGKGILMEGRRGVEALCYLGSYGNDRPRGPVPTYIGREDWWASLDKEVLAKGQGFLIKYGELMVEKGLLAP